MLAEFCGIVFKATSHIHFFSVGLSHPGKFRVIRKRCRSMTSSVKVMFVKLKSLEFLIFFSTVKRRSPRPVKFRHIRPVLIDCSTWGFNCSWASWRNLRSGLTSNWCRISRSTVVRIRVWPLIIRARITLFSGTRVSSAPKTWDTYTWAALTPWIKATAWSLGTWSWPITCIATWYNWSTWNWSTWSQSRRLIVTWSLPWIRPAHTVACIARVPSNLPIWVASTHLCFKIIICFLSTIPVVSWDACTCWNVGSPVILSIINAAILACLANRVVNALSRSRRKSTS